MRRASRLSFFVLLVSIWGWSQSTKIVIPAGTPEDKELANIAAEQDAQKRIPMYEDFAKTYENNKPAFAYAEWQLSQLYLAAGDAGKAVDPGNKALALYPTNLDIIVSQAGVDQALKDNGAVVDLAARGAAVYHSIATQSKPADVSDVDWTHRIADEEAEAKPGYDFLEVAAYNAINAEQDGNKRMSYIEKFTPAFPKSQFEKPVSQLALYTLNQLNQPERLEAYGEKALAANPDSVPTLLMLANAYSEDPKQLTKAATYASKVISLEGANATSGDKVQRNSAGLAHSTLGYVYLKQEKIAAALPELRTAVSLLQDDPQDQQAALFRLGWAYAKMNHRADAIASLQKAVAINGPYQAPAKDMLAKVTAAGKKQ